MINCVRFKYLVKSGRIVVDILQNYFDSGSRRFRIESSIFRSNDQIVNRNFFVIQLRLDHDVAARLVNVELLVLEKIKSNQIK